MITDSFAEKENMMTKQKMLKLIIIKLLNIWTINFISIHLV